MNRLTFALIVTTFCATFSALAGTAVEMQPAPSPAQDENKNSTEIFNYETTYTGTSDYQRYSGRLGDSDSLYNQISYAHRFLITGNWYLRLGAEYERFDFGGDNGSNRLLVPTCPSCGIVGHNNGLPDHLQTIHALVAYEYIFKDHRSEEHTSELQSRFGISYAVFCLKKTH